MKISSFLFIILFLSTKSSSLKKVCRSPELKEVDWYVIILLPLLSTNNKLKYLYIDNTISQFKEYTYKEKNFPPSLITSYTLNSKDNNFNYFFWNDDQKYENGPESSTFNGGHSKGTLIYDKNYGSFLLHSLPRFPARKIGNYVLTKLPNNAGKYGQHFLCISINKNTAEKIAETLNYINVFVNKSVKKDRVNLIENKWVKGLIKTSYSSNLPKNAENNIMSIKGIKFTVFSKSPSFNVIPFDYRLRDYYQDHFYVRTWTRPKLASPICEKYQIRNILNLNFLGKFMFKETYEHSKWAVSAKKNIACFGDLNHSVSQSKRGGNIVCFNNKNVADFLKNAIISKDKC